MPLPSEDIVAFYSLSGAPKVLRHLQEAFGAGWIAATSDSGI